MSRKTKTKQINGHEYSVTQMDAIEAFKVQTYLAKIITPVLKETQIDEYKNINNFFASIIPKLADHVDDEKFHNFFIKMTREAFRDGNRVDFNTCYTGNLKEAYLAFAFVLEVNFMDFIKDVLGDEMAQALGAGTS